MSRLSQPRPLMLAICLSVTLFQVAPAVAEDAPPLRVSYGQCLDKTQGVTLEINNCIGTEFDFQDHRLNVAYKEVRKTLSQAQRATLRDEERIWIADRDKACAPPADGGTADMLGANECKLNRTAVRAAELEAQRNHP